MQGQTTANAGNYPRPCALGTTENTAWGATQKISIGEKAVGW